MRGDERAPSSPQAARGSRTGARAHANSRRTRRATQLRTRATSPTATTQAGPTPAGGLPHTTHTPHRIYNPYLYTHRGRAQNDDERETQISKLSIIAKPQPTRAARKSSHILAPVKSRRCPQPTRLQTEARVRVRFVSSTPVQSHATSQAALASINERSPRSDCEPPNNRARTAPMAVQPTWRHGKCGCAAVRDTAALTRRACGAHRALLARSGTRARSRSGARALAHARSRARVAVALNRRS